MLKIFTDVTTSIFTPVYCDESRDGEVVKQFNISKFSASYYWLEVRCNGMTVCNPLVKC